MWSLGAMLDSTVVEPRVEHSCVRSVHGIMQAQVSDAVETPC